MEDTVLVTGCAGFIGSAVAEALLARGERVLGIDNFNSYYDPQLKRDRVARGSDPAYRVAEIDLADRAALSSLMAETRPARIVHLAAQAGVRYSFENPHAYIDSNIAGFVNLLEAARAAGNVRHFVYASSSSVYGANVKQPFSIDDPVERPISLYAATKRANELIAQVYAMQFGLCLTGLRYFTVYGPRQRPDMALHRAIDAALRGTPFPLFGDGSQRRDFTFVDDIVSANLLAAEADVPAGTVVNVAGGAVARLRDEELGQSGLVVELILLGFVLLLAAAIFAFWKAGGMTWLNDRLNSITTY